MDAKTRSYVRVRAGDSCEYCRLPQRVVQFRFHIEHIVPKTHGGSDTSDNLALACPRCNFNKGPNLTGIDPDDGSIVILFNPRMDDWNAHFAFYDFVVLGKTPCGRATVAVLKFNEDTRVRLRTELSRKGL